MSTYPYGYQVVQRPPIRWKRLLGKAVPAWARDVAWLRVGVLFLNIALWAVLVAGAIHFFS